MSEQQTAEKDRGQSGELVRLDTAQRYLDRALAAEDALTRVRELLDRWDGVIAECQQADPRWIIDRSVTTLITARDELRRALPHVIPPEGGRA